jgi:hypothetical protein
VCALLAAQTSLTCFHDFENASLYVIFSCVLSETDSASAQSNISGNAHGAQRGADFAGVACRPDRKSHFISELVLYFMAGNSRECDADDLEDARW